MHPRTVGHTSGTARRRSTNLLEFGQGCGIVRDMRKRSSIDEKQIRERLSAPETAFSSADGKNPAAVALGRMGGLKGGKARAESLSARRRSEIATLAAQARWSVKRR